MIAKPFLFPTYPKHATHHKSNSAKGSLRKRQVSKPCRFLSGALKAKINSSP
jgi:hypothetical protein